VTQGVTSCIVIMEAATVAPPLKMMVTTNTVDAEQYIYGIVAVIMKDRFAV
jgi:hypothetical protein